MLSLSLFFTILLSLTIALALFPAVLRLLGRLIGNSIRSKTQQRRELLFSRAASEQKEQEQATRDKTAGESGDKASSSTSLDSDWEKIDKSGTGTPPTKAGESKSYDGVIAFFHPFCNAGGGGERVLFAAIRTTQHKYPNALCVVYTGDHDASKEQILANARNRFNISLNSARVTFLYLSTREWVLASSWPHFTLLGQSLGSLVLGWDALNLLVPDIFIDTMGYAFILALCKWLFPSLPTGAYVHYPTISTDMLSSLQDDVGGGDRGLNAGQGKDGWKGTAKQWYWQVFARLYSWVGGSVDVVMTNSSWTQAHIQQLWGPARRRRKKTFPIEVVYPPCAVEELREKIPLNAESEKSRTRDLLYIAQFRPEKMHHLIIAAFTTLLQSLPEGTQPKPNLILVGSVRDDADAQRVYKLRLQAQPIRSHVNFQINAPWSQILHLLATSSIGVNGMWNEHFGIGVVEYQAAGLIAVVNASGGPKEDIVVDVPGPGGGRTGFLAADEGEFVRAFREALGLGGEERLEMRWRARGSSERFSERVFERAWRGQVGRLVGLCRER